MHQLTGRLSSHVPKASSSGIEAPSIGADTADPIAEGGEPSGGPGVLAPSTDIREKRRKADWNKLREFVSTPNTFPSGLVEGSNSGGLLVRIRSILGFLPFSQLDPQRFRQGGQSGRSPQDIAKELVSTRIRVKVLEVAEERGRLVVSEKEAATALRLRRVTEGEVVEARVNAVTDFGVFVDLLLDGEEGDSGLTGLVHVSEVSWDPIGNLRDAFEIGQQLRVKVLRVDRTRQRVALSMKQLLPDPLLQTLDNILPARMGQDSSPSPPDSNSLEKWSTIADAAVADDPTQDLDSELLLLPLPGLDQVCEELAREEGVELISLGRQAIERRVVSQDLELWMSSAPVEDGSFTLLARAGRQVQEVYVTSSLDRESMKQAVQRVTGRVL